MSVTGKLEPKINKPSILSDSTPTPARSTWKDMNNSFRKDKDTHLSVIPTLIRWKQPQRLEGDQLLKPELLQMFFADED